MEAIVQELCQSCQFQIRTSFYDNKELSQSYDNARKSRAMFNLMNKKGNAFEARLPNIGDLVFFENTERRPAVKPQKTKGGKEKAPAKAACGQCN